MSEELDRAARQLIEAGRDGVPPDALIAARIRRAVDGALHSSAPQVRSSKRAAPLFAAFGVATLAGVLYAAELVRSGQQAAPAGNTASVTLRARAPVVAAPSTPPETSNSVDPAVPAASSEPIASSAPPPTSEPARSSTAERVPRTPPTRSQKLAAEIALLARVNAAVNGGNGAKALELLAEYDREFRPGLLGEERAAASILALCAAGRKAEARASAQRFYAKSQHSPHAPRIAKSCVGGR
ncbi:MAG TPA: hypothetical protein VJV79_40835 [Polyangiaceae bacterium]|nr:hypothetical protein [Polyangiaceae bacterium]